MEWKSFKSSVDWSACINNDHNATQPCSIYMSNTNTGRPVWIKSIQCYKDTVWDNEGLKQNLNCGIKNAKNACSEFENKKNPVHSTFVQTKPVHCSCRSIALWS